MNEQPVIACYGLGKRYDRAGAPALDGVDLEVSRNSVFGFLGPNGAGKTTMIRILAGLMSQTTGDAYVDGHRVGIHGEHRARIGVLRQYPVYYPWMTAAELLQFAAGLYGVDRATARRRSDELLELVGLADHRRRRIGAFSGGMVQRLGIAQALINRPTVLLLDEPVSSLDPIGRRDVLAVIERLGAEEGIGAGTSVFMSTHILADVERVCDTVGVINQGRMIAVEEVSALKERYGSRKLELRFAAPAQAARFVERAEHEGWSVNSAAEDPVVWVFAPSPARNAAGSAGATGSDGATDSIGTAGSDGSESGDGEAFRRRVLAAVVEERLDLESLQSRASLEEAFVELIGVQPDAEVAAV